MKTKEELLEYSVKMLNRGDSFAAIHSYLKRNCDDEQTIKEIFIAVDEIGREQRNQEDTKIDFKDFFTYGRIIGLVVVGLGVFLMVTLWDKGFIATLPFVLIGIGVLGVFGKIK